MPQFRRKQAIISRQFKIRRDPVELAQIGVGDIAIDLHIRCSYRGTGLAQPRDLIRGETHFDKHVIRALPQGFGMPI